MDAAQLLTNSLSIDAQTRAQATEQLEAVARSNFQGYMHTLATELANENQRPAIRNAAGLAFKNAIASRDIVNQPDLSARWLSLPDAATAPLKQSVLSTLGTQVNAAGRPAAQCVAAIGAIELPAGKWQELIPSMLEFVQNQDNTLLRVNTLQAIGYLCEIMDPEILSSRSNEILTAVVQGARKEEPNREVQKAAINALYNSLEFIRDNFDREGERNYIMQVVCEATQIGDKDVQTGAFECLVRIMDLYYDKMDFYMERALFGLTMSGMRHPEESVALQAIEFWSTVAEQEIEFNIEAREAQSWGEVPIQESRNFAKNAMAEILPVLLELLSTQSEDDDEDDWTRSMAAAVCLELLAKDIGDEIVQFVVPFVERGITHSSWQAREAAVMAFGSILDGPDGITLSPLVTQALPALIAMMQNDPSLQVRDTVAWTIAKITDVMLEVINPENHLNSMIEAIVRGLSSSPRIVNSCCTALGHLATQLSRPADATSTDEIPTSPMSRFYSGILGALMPITERPTNDNNCRTAAYQTIATYITYCAQDTLPMVTEITSAMLARQEALIGMHSQLVGMDDRNNWNDMQISICVVLQSAIHKSPANILPSSDRIMTNLLGLISSVGKHAAVLEDAFATVGALATEMETGFNKYVEAFMPFLLTALASFEDHTVAQAAVFASADMSRAIGDAITPHAERLMVALIEVLRSPVIQREVKPHAIATIGEIGLAIGPAFQPYLDTVMGILSQAGSTATSPTDIIYTEFVWTMREAIVEAFTGILNGMRAADPTPFSQYVPGVLGFLKTWWADVDRTSVYATASLGLIGDIGSTFGVAVRDELLQEWVQQAIQSGKQRGCTKRTKTNAQYAQKVVRELSK